MTSPQASRAEVVGLEPAPTGLCLVQALLNSQLAGLPDLLDEAPAAQLWLEGSLATWSQRTGDPPPNLTLRRSDLPLLRDLRQQVRSWLQGQRSGGDAAPTTGELVLNMRLWIVDGRVVYRPVVGGLEGVTSMVSTEVLLAAQTGMLPRLKTCGNPDCGAAFFDQSRNSSRVWHDVKTCGNAANLRAHRARLRNGRDE